MEPQVLEKFLDAGVEPTFLAHPENESPVEKAVRAQDLANTHAGIHRRYGDDIPDEKMGIHSYVVRQMKARGMTPKCSIMQKAEDFEKATFSDKPWDGSASNYASTEAYCSACLIDMNPDGKTKVQGLCKLPYKEPGGAINRGALRAINSALAGGRGGVQAPPDVLASARKRAASLSSQAGIGQVNQ